MFRPSELVIFIHLNLLVLQSEPEEMPPEAKMRMKNIGRDTPTSAGPNSFNKGKHGFSDNQKLWERNIKSHLGNVHDQDN